MGGNRRLLSFEECYFYGGKYCFCCCHPAKGKLNARTPLLEDEEEEEFGLAREEKDSILSDSNMALY